MMSPASNTPVHLWFASLNDFAALHRTTDSLLRPCSAAALLRYRHGSHLFDAMRISFSALLPL